jgi:hypothetical protein
MQDAMAYRILMLGWIGYRERKDQMHNRINREHQDANRIKERKNATKKRKQKQTPGIEGPDRTDK